MSNTQDLQSLANVNYRESHSNSLDNLVEISASSPEVIRSTNVNSSQTNDLVELDLPCANNTLKIESIQNGYCNIANIDQNVVIRHDNFSEKHTDNRCIDDGNSSSQHDSNLVLRRNTRSSTKEEKQRQNEEIFVLESSSISSETGSWEALFPGNCNNAGIKDICKIFLSQEKLHCTENTGCSTSVVQHQTQKPVCTACFIDASTLFDDNELAMITSSSHSINDVQVSGHINDATETQLRDMSLDLNKSITTVENFKDIDVLDIIPDTSTSFETDKSKIKSDNFEKYSHDELISNIPVSKNFKTQSENEKLQGQNLFRNSIQQFSGHLISPKIACSREDVTNFYTIYSLPSCDDRLVFPETPHNSIVQIAKGM